jgi:sodium/potassium/calcium exchanger 6
MFVSTVVAGCVILASGGVACRGALIRDVAALGVAVSVVAYTLERGAIGMWTETLYLSMYAAFVLVVLIADIYHRAVTVPRARHEDAMRERMRQLEAERIASQRAGDALNALFEAAAVEGGGGGGNGSVGGGSSGAKYDDRTHASAPPRMGGATNTALTAVLAALSNYGDVGGDDDLDIPRNSNYGSATSSAGNNGRHRHHTAVTGWGIESYIEGSRSWDRPIVLGGSEGIIHARGHRNHPRRPRPEWDDGGDGVHNMHHSPSPYHFMVEDCDNNDGAATSSSAADQYARLLCIKGGSSSYPAHNWAGAFQDGRRELAEHFREHWRDIMDDEESNRLERCLLIIEYPMTLARKVRARVYYSTRLNGFIDIWIPLTIFLLLLFYSLLYRYRAKVHTVVHSLQYHLRYHPSGWAFTS